MGVLSKQTGYATGGILQQGQRWGSLGQEGMQGEQRELEVWNKFPLPSGRRKGPTARDKEEEEEGRERLKPIGTYPQRSSTSRMAQSLQSWARHRTGILCRAASGAGPCPAATSQPPAC